ncbi:MAG: hypothetical protein RSC10_03010 [Longicatena sp.]
MEKTINVSFNDCIEVSQDEFSKLQEQIEVNRAIKTNEEFEKGTRTGLSFNEFEKFLNRKLDV